MSHIRIYEEVLLASRTGFRAVDNDGMYLSYKRNLMHYVFHILPRVSNMSNTVHCIYLTSLQIFVMP